MFGKANALIYVRRSSLLIAGKHIKPARLNFPPDATFNLELVDADVFGTLCQDFFTSSGLKGQRTLLVLDHSVVFAKTIALATGSKPTQLTSDFIAHIPLSQGDRACLSFKTTDTLRLFATNAALYQVIADALHDAGGGKLVAITPVAAYGISEGEQLSSTIVDQLLRDTTVRTKANFLGVKPS